MKLATARRLRDFLRKQNVKATVPLGQGGQNGDGYFVKVNKGALIFRSVDEYNAYARKEQQRLLDWCRDHGISVADRRTPLERMIDEACGVKP